MNTYRLSQKKETHFRTSFLKKLLKVDVFRKHDFYTFDFQAFMVRV